MMRTTILLTIVLVAITSVSALAENGGEGNQPSFPENHFAEQPGYPESVTIVDDRDWWELVTEGNSVVLNEPPTQVAIAKGRRSMTEERAIGDAFAQLEQELSVWLAPDVPDTWQPPIELVRTLVMDRAIEPVDLDLGALGIREDSLGDLPDALYVATFKADFSEIRRGQLVDAYRQELGSQRLNYLGVGLLFVFICLAILAIYIRVDEATKGYFTNRLRTIAVSAAVGSGYLVYRLIA